MTALAHDAPPRHRGFWLGALGRFGRHRRSVLAAAALVGLVLACLLVPVVSPHDPYDVEFAQKQQGPSLEHPAGTDFFGRDLLERLALGGRTSLTVAAAALGLILFLGIAYGSLAAAAGGRVDALMMRALDGLLAIPRFPVIVIILVIAGLRTNELTLILALSITSWMVTARLVRTELVSLRRRDFVRAAHSVGARPRHVLLRHLLPNATGILLVAALLELPAIILNEAFVSTLGLGLNPPAATWGNLAYDGIRVGRLWEVLLPSIAIAIFAVSANLVADGLDDALDPRRSAQR
ncbi:MAG: ABC transporter permease [Pseudomonadota bacterium]